jgi:hypothetical protein
MRIRILLLVLVLPVAFAAVVASIAMAGGQSELAKVRNATAAFHDIQSAKAAGYGLEMNGPLKDVSGNACIADLAVPSEGAMGEHWVSVARVVNPALDPADPEVLVYENRNNGSLKLVAVEYVVFAADVTGTPKLFGVPFDYNSGARYNLPPFWALHAWVWKPNPSDALTDPTTGIFNAWNPRVSC